MELLSNLPWPTIVSYVITFVFGLAIVSPFVVKARAVSKELKELFAEIEEDLEDGKLNKDELLEIVKEASDIVSVLK